MRTPNDEQAEALGFAFIGAVFSAGFLLGVVVALWGHQ